VGHGQDKQDRILLQGMCENPRQLAHQILLHFMPLLLATANIEGDVIKISSAPNEISSLYFHPMQLLHYLRNALLGLPHL